MHVTCLAPATARDGARRCSISHSILPTEPWRNGTPRAGGTDTVDAERGRAVHGDGGQRDRGFFRTLLEEGKIGVEERAARRPVTDRGSGVVTLGLLVAAASRLNHAVVLTLRLGTRRAELRRAGCLSVS